VQLLAVPRRAVGWQVVLRLLLVVRLQVLPRVD